MHDIQTIMDRSALISSSIKIMISKSKYIYTSLQHHKILLISLTSPTGTAQYLGKRYPVISRPFIAAVEPSTEPTGQASTQAPVIASTRHAQEWRHANHPVRRCNDDAAIDESQRLSRHAGRGSDIYATLGQNVAKRKLCLTNWKR